VSVTDAVDICSVALARSVASSTDSRSVVVAVRTAGTL